MNDVWIVLGKADDRPPQERNIDGLIERYGDPVMKLARILVEDMEYIDPGSCGGSWGELPERDLEYYALCVKALIDRRPLLEEALAYDERTGEGER